MKPERWARIEQIYHAALEREPAERAPYLDEACGGDETLRRQVAALLASDDQAPGFIESPALLVAAQALAASNLTEARTKAEQSFSLQTGGQIGAYQLLGPIGRGGMGEVHLALDPRLGRKVAIKLLPPKFTADAERVRRFAQEARAASALNHPNIITIHEIGEVATEAGATRYIVTEYVEGETLRELMANASERRMKLSEAIDVTSQIAAALSAAHDAGIIHRDIKPENVMVRRDRLVKVLDFGLAKLTDERAGERESERAGNNDCAVSRSPTPPLSHSTASGMVMGTPRYMAPEQARGARMDARADIFSLGVMLYEMVAGRAPFTGATAGDVIAAILRDDPASLTDHAPEVPRELAQIVNKALRKKLDERYQSAGALLDDLKRLKRRLEPEDELNDELAWPGQQESEDDAPTGPGKATPSGATKKQAATTGDAGTALAPAKNRAAGVWRRRSMAVCVLALVVAGAGWIYKRNASMNKAKAALPRIEELAQAERFFEAYDLAIEAQKYLPNDPTLTRLMRTIADDLSVVTDPPGAQVYLKRFTPDGAGNFTARQSIGVTPINHRQIARGAYVVSIEKEGYANIERTVTGLMLRIGGLLAPSQPISLDAKLIETANVPSRMSYVPGGDYRLTSWARPTDKSVRLEAYFIDKYEVTNREYKEFISAGGYLKREYWRHLISTVSGSERGATNAQADGVALATARDTDSKLMLATARGTDSAWEEAIREFKDRTGLPGPRGWANQDFPEGKADHPVTDISWYEAAAYAAFRGKELPTVFQWEKAARSSQLRGGVGYYFMPWGPFTGTIEHRANFSGRGTLPVESLEFGLSPYGCYHMAGNVAEWCRNESSEGFAMTGGSWGDQPYLFGSYGNYPGSYSSSKLGFRCALSAPGATGDQGAMPLLTKTGVPVYTPLSDASFRAWQEHYRYAQPPLDAKIEETTETDHWRRQKITYVGAEGERAIAYLYLPKNYPPPWQVIQYMPSDDVFLAIESLLTRGEVAVGSFIKSGRAVLAVALKGFPERPWPPNRTRPSEETVEYRDQILNWTADQRRGLDYITTRPDLDADRIAYYAVSVGDGRKLLLPAVETRYRSVILVAAGLRQNFTRVLPEINPVNLLPQIRAPKLIVLGRYDENLTLKYHAEPLLKLLRGPKRVFIHDSGHAPLPEIYVPPINDWLDETLGPVRR